MFFFSCPSCERRIAICSEITPKLYKCPGCLIALAFITTQRTLVDKIKDSYSPVELIQTINEYI